MSVTAASNTSAMCESEIIALARQSFRRYRSLSDLVSGLTTLTTAFALSTAQNAMTDSIVLSPNTTTRSPRSTPRADR